MNPLISVIVPIYNVEKYLSICLESIINQTYRNLEIILVDDGSSDNCPQICDEYAKKDTRIKVIHKKNEGSAEARNVGIRLATGDYFWFIDSDDYASELFLDLLIRVAFKENSQIVECNSIKVVHEQNYIFSNDSQINEVKTYSNKDAFKMLMKENEFHHYIWNKIYHKSVILDVEFPKGKYIDDEYWTYRVFGKAESVSKIDACLYCYVQHSSSAINRKFSTKRLDMLEAKSEQFDYVIERYPDMYLQAKLDLHSACMFLCQYSLKYFDSNERSYSINYLKEYIKKCELTKEELRNFNGKRRIWLSFSKRNFMLCCKVRNLFGIGL